MILKVLVILVLLYVGYRIVVMILRRVKVQDVKGYQLYAKPSKGEDLVQDPFCKIYVPKSQAYVKEINGREQYFCGSACCVKYLSEKK